MALSKSPIYVALDAGLPTMFDASLLIRIPGVANLVGSPKDLTTETTKITEKILLKTSVDSLRSVVSGL